VSGRSAWTGLTAAKATRPARKRNEVAVARMVKACLEGHTWRRTARTPHALSVGRRGEGWCVSVCVRAVCMCMVWSLCRGRAGIVSSPIQGLRGYGTKNGRQGRQEASQGDRIVWKRWSLARRTVR